ncbi:MAG: hypothetical protein KAV00_17290, partial [Phycisphaerae bacterium]|nr:hypothetical protein [Phycisphaerae bacterium]
MSSIMWTSYPVRLVFMLGVMGRLVEHESLCSRSRRNWASAHRAIPASDSMMPFASALALTSLQVCSGILLISRVRLAAVLGDLGQLGHGAI